GIDGPIEVTPTALHSNIRLIHTPGFVRRLEMTAQPLLQFGTVTLNPTPDRRVIGLQTALGEQLFDIAERQRVPKIPAHGTKNQLRRRLPPLEDCRSGRVLHDLCRLPAISAKVATHPRRETGPMLILRHHCAQRLLCRRGSRKVDQMIILGGRANQVVIITAESPYSPVVVLGRLRQLWTNSVSR